MALDRAVYKLSFDTKFEDFVEGLVPGCSFVKFKSMYKYMYLRCVASVLRIQVYSPRTAVLMIGNH